MSDDIAETLEAGLVVKLDVVARVEELRDHAAGPPRWHVEVLSVSASG